MDASAAFFAGHSATSFGSEAEVGRGPKSGDPVENDPVRTLGRLQSPARPATIHGMLVGCSMDARHTKLDIDTEDQIETFRAQDLF